MSEFLITAALVVIVVEVSILITKLTKKFCEDDFNPDNWK